MSAGSPRRVRAAAGQTLVGALVVLLLGALLLGAGTLAVRRQVARAEPVAAARAFASELRLRRSQAIARARRLGLVFEQRADGGWRVAVHEDGDGDGLRASDRASGRDPLLEGPWDFRVRFGALGPGFLAGLPGLPSPPPSSRPLPDLEDPVRFGRGDVLSFSPRGTTTAGTLYLTDGHERQLAVVVAGASARVRIWEWLGPDEGWRRR